MKNVPLDWSDIKTEKAREEEESAWRTKIFFTGCSFLLAGFVGVLFAGYHRFLLGALIAGFTALVGLILIVYWNSLAKSAPGA